MRKINTLIRLIKTEPKKIPGILMGYFTKSPLSHLIPDKKFLSLQYKTIFGEKIDWENPVTFNEKLQWLKINNRNKEYIKLVDKYAVKDYVAKTIGEKYVVPTLGVWDRFEDINFETLPGQFVLKCTHDSGSVVICQNKENFEFTLAKKKLEKGLKKNLFWHGREWPYKFVPPKIIAEKYLEDAENSGGLKDYKFFCFNGEVRCFKIDFNRFIQHKANYYNRNKQLLPFGEEVCPPDFDYYIEIPRNIDTMIELAEKLSKGQPFVRIDFYNVNGKIYFGEMTFFPAAGFGKFIPSEWDKILGKWMNISKQQQEISNGKTSINQ